MTDKSASIRANDRPILRKTFAALIDSYFFIFKMAGLNQDPATYLDSWILKKIEDRWTQIGKRTSVCLTDPIPSRRKSMSQVQIGSFGPEWESKKGCG